MERNVSVQELVQHSKPEDVWIVVDNKVYDMTSFAPTHPGGSDIIYRHAGHDATAEYNEVHAPSLISTTLSPKEHVGTLDESTITDDWGSTSVSPSTSPSAPTARPPLSSIINLYDFEDAAHKSLSAKSWAYINGGSNDNITRDANDTFLKRIWFRPRVMASVGKVNMRTTLFGAELSIPVFISPTGAARTGGPDGELALARGAGRTGIVHCFSTPSSFPYGEILEATPERCFFQLYVNKDRAKTEEALRLVEASGKVKAVFVTVDLPVVSKREADERVKMEAPVVNANTGVEVSGGDSKGGGLARQTGSFIDPELRWEDLKWLRRITKLPLVIKGIQRSEDARLALEMGCDGIVVSNHGGRAADNAPPAILTLLELHKNCPEIFGAVEVLVDGGFRRGSDVVKAICLGASAVGFGRPFVYSLGYGQEGVEHTVEIIKDEIETAMRLCGIVDLMRDSSPDFVNTGDIEHLIPSERHSYVRKVVKARAKL